MFCIFMLMTCWGRRNEVLTLRLFSLTHPVIWSVRFQMFVLMGTLSCYMFLKSLSDMLHKYTDILHVFIYKAMKKPWSSPHFFVFLGKSDIGGVIYGYVKRHRNPVYKKKRGCWLSFVQYYWCSQPTGSVLVDHFHAEKLSCCQIRTFLDGTGWCIHI